MKLPDLPLSEGPNLAGISKKAGFDGWSITLPSVICIKSAGWIP
jgi:hypothetical protein